MENIYKQYLEKHASQTPIWSQAGASIGPFIAVAMHGSPGFLQASYNGAMTELIFGALCSWFRAYWAVGMIVKNDETY